ncbi:MAG: TolC family protein, partial [Lysobacter sp.]
MASSLLQARGARLRVSAERGAGSDHFDRPRTRPALRSLVLGLAFAWSLLAHPLVSTAEAAAAESLPGADVASIRAWLYTNNPQLRALQADADAAEARILPAGALPDPMASVQLKEIDPNRPSLLPGNVGSTTYLLKQRFPLWGKRELSRNVARYEAQSVQYQRDATALELLAQAEEAYVRYWHIREAVVVIDRQLALL